MKNTVIICENDEDIILVCRMILEKSSYDVRIFKTTDDLFLNIEDINPLLILMDIWLPSIGGEEATIILKKNPKTSNIPVILFSACTEIVKTAQRSGADGFLSKPFEIKELLDLVKSYRIK